MTTGHVKDWHAIYIFWRQPLVTVVREIAVSIDRFIDFVIFLCSRSLYTWATTSGGSPLLFLGKMMYESKGCLQLKRNEILMIRKKEKRCFQL